jgi:hypothetical protein
MKKLIGTLLLFSLIPTSFAKANITCFTPRESKKIIIKKDSIAMSQQIFGAARNLASEAKVRTRLHGTGFTKVMYIGGDKHTIHIENKNKFSELDDYMLVRSQKGHEMTYPLECKK